MRILLVLLLTAATAFSQTSWVFNPYTGKQDAVSIVPSGTPGTWGTIAGTLSNQTDLQTALNAKQPLDSDLTAIAALTTQTFGISLLDDPDAATARSTLGLVIGTNVLAPNGNGSALTGIIFSQIGGIASDAQIPTAVARDAEVAAGYQTLDGDLTSLAAATATDSMYYRSVANTWAPVALGANMTFAGGTLSSTNTWGSITGTLAAQTDLQAALSALQPLDSDLTLLAGVTSTAYGRGLLDDANAAATRVTIGLDTLGNLTASLGITGTASTTTFLRGDGQWVSLGGGATWGAITGSMSAQTDLTIALNAKQPLDGDLTSIAAAAGTNTIYYRSAANTWTPVTIGSNLTFTSGTLAATGGGGGGGTWGSITGTLSAQTDLQAVLDTKQPLDADLTSLSGASSTGALYYRSASNTWAPVTIGSNLTFTGGTLSAAGGGSGTPGGANTQVQFNDASAFGGDSAFTYNKTTDTLSVPTLTTTVLNATNFLVLDNVDQSHGMSIVANENLSTNINLRLDLDGATRDLNIMGNAAISGTNTGDQTGTTVAFADVDNNFVATSVGAAIEELNDVNATGPNSTSAKVHWTQIEGMPAGFVDGTDDGGSGGGTPGGVDTQVQFNDGGVFGGDAGFTYNKTTDVLTVPTLTTTVLNAGSLEFEGATADAFETTITAIDPTADRVVQLPNANTIIPVYGYVATYTGFTGPHTITLPDSNFTVARTDAANTFTGLQQFTPSATLAGLNVGSVSSDPSTPSNGAVWYNSVANELRARINSATIALGAGGGAPANATYLTTTSNGALSANVVVGTTPGGELGGTWASPTLDDGVTVDNWTMGASFGTTPAANDNDTSLATTAYVQAELSALATDTVVEQNKDLTNANNTLPCEFIIVCSAPTGDLTTGTTKAYFDAPYAFTITSLSASVMTAPTGASVVVDVNEAGSTIMTTTKLSVAAGSTNSVGSTAPVITDNAIAANARVTFDIDQVGSTIPGTWLIVTIQGVR